MSLREQNKAYNRRRILAAADTIIREEGIDKLSMRHLAKVAGVSLRTPYNLFGSKTEVLIGLLQAPVAALFGELGALPRGDGILAQAFVMLDRVAAQVAADEAFFRGIYWQMMSTDQPDARRGAIDGVMRMTRPVLDLARDAGELETDVDIQTLNRHLTIVTLSLAGMWASGLFEFDELVEHIRQSWCNTLVQVSSGSGRVQLRCACADAWIGGSRLVERAHARESGLPQPAGPFETCGVDRSYRGGMPPGPASTMQR